MRCDEARDVLLRQLDEAAAPEIRRDLDSHLDACRECRTTADDIAVMRARARVWHEVVPPPWNPAPGLAETPRHAGRPSAAGWRAALLRWLPPLASGAALLLALAAWLNPAAAPEAGAGPLPGADAAAGNASVAELLQAAREERRQELEALSTLLKAEMDRRDLATQQSLKYVIVHQIESQRELDRLRGRLQPAAAAGPAGRESL